MSIAAKVRDAPRAIKNESDESARGGHFAGRAIVEPALFSGGREQFVLQLACADAATACRHDTIVVEHDWKSAALWASWKKMAGRWRRNPGKRRKTWTRVGTRFASHSGDRARKARRRRLRAGRCLRDWSGVWLCHDSLPAIVNFPTAPQPIAIISSMTRHPAITTAGSRFLTASLTNPENFGNHLRKCGDMIIATNGEL